MASRLSLATQAKIWRGLENIGMGIERWTGPTQATPAFTRTVTISEPFVPGEILLYFYIPPEYIKRKPKDRFPAFLNFHGGGFTIGDATDDARWAHDVIRHLDSIVVSANYRLAPENPYPVAVQDGACVLHYLATHAEELAIDTEKVVTCGFSAGGTLCITAPMLYNALLQPEEYNQYASSMAVPDDWFPVHARTWAEQGRCNVTALAAFYPALDFTLTREQRRITNPAPSHNLSPMLTGLFDASFLPLPEDMAPPDPSMVTSDDTFSNENAIENPNNPRLTLTQTASIPPEESLSRTTTSTPGSLSRTTTAPSGGLTPSSSPSRSASQSTVSLSSSPNGPDLESSSSIPTFSVTQPTILKSSSSDPDALELSKSDALSLQPAKSNTPAALTRTITSRSSRPSPVKMASGFLGRSTSARPPLQRDKSALSFRSFRSYQGDKARPTPGSAPSDAPCPALFDPFLSPAQASAAMVKELLPNDCVIYTCEYDMLQAEGERFAGSLAAAGKRVCYKKVTRVPHGWDKSPGVIAWGDEAMKGREKVAEVYMEVCGVLGAVLGIKAKVVDEIKKEGRRGWLHRRGSKKNGSKDKVMTVKDRGTDEKMEKLSKEEARKSVQQARKMNEMAEEEVRKSVELMGRQGDKSTVKGKSSKTSLGSKGSTRSKSSRRE